MTRFVDRTLVIDARGCPLVVAIDYSSFFLTISSVRPGYAKKKPDLVEFIQTYRTGFHIDWDKKVIMSFFSSFHIRYLQCALEVRCIL